MATSGTTSFTLDIMDLIEEAYERVGVESRNGYDLKTAVRSLNLLMREWDNRGINFWTLVERTESVAADATTVTLDADVVDVLWMNWRTGSGTSQNDRNMTRFGMTEYAALANKNQTGQPSQYWINRVSAAPVVYLWPVPVEAGTLVYYVMRRLEDVDEYDENTDIPFRFETALTAGLAYYLSMKTPSAADRIPILKAEYEEQFRLAADEDRERASLFLVPGCYS